MGVQETLARLRAALLDLSDRNPLLNFAHPAHPCLGLVGERPNDLYARLLQGHAFSFQAAPTPQAQHISFDWMESGAQREGRANGVLQTAHGPDELAALLRKLHRQAEEIADEIGIGQLFLAFGFLEWSDPAAPDKPLLAPLLLMPVRLKKASSHDMLGPLNYSLEYSGEAAATNLSLVERFMRLDIEVPAVTDDDQPEQYVAKIESLPRLQPTWRVRRWLTLSLLPTGNAVLYRDLDQTRWYEPQSFLGNPLLREWLEAPTKTETRKDEELTDHTAAALPPLIFPADDAQQAVLRDAMADRNLVVQAPPGTGSSRTIANLVAAAIAGGKSVLCVAPKRTALVDLHRHLAEAGFGEFCLTLHAGSIARAPFLQSLDQRQRLVLSPPDSSRLAQTLSRKQNLQTRMDGYTELMERPVEGVKRSIFDVLWERELCLQMNPRLRPLVASLCRIDWLPAPSFDMDDLRRRAGALQNELVKVSESGRQWTSHPWYGVTAQLDDGNRTEALKAAEAVVRNGDALQAAAGALQEAIGVPAFVSRDDLQRVAQWDGSLPAIAPSAPPELLEALRDRETRIRLGQFIDDLRLIARERQTLAADFRDVPSELDRIDLSPLRLLRGTTLEGLPLEQFETTVGLHEAVVHDLQRAREAVQAAVEGLGISAPITLSFIECVDQTISLLVEVPFDLLRLRDPVLLDESLAGMRREAAERGAQLQDRRRTLSLEYNIPLDRDLEELETHARALQSTPAIARLYSGAYRRGRRFFMEVHQGGKAADSRTMADAIWDLRDHLELSQRYAANVEFQQAFGKIFQGIDTPFQQLVALENWYAKARAALEGLGGAAPEFLALLLNGPLEHLASLRRWAETNGRALQMIRSLKSHVQKTIERDPEHALHVDRDTLDTMAEKLEGRVAALQAALAVAQQLSLAPTKSIVEIPALLRKLETYRKQESRILGNRAMERLLGTSFTGSRTAIAPLQEALSWSEQAANLPLPPELTGWLFSRDYANRHDSIMPLLANLREAVRTWEGAWARLESVLGLQPEVWVAPDTSVTVAGLVERTKRALAHPDSLRDWVEYLRAAHALAQDGAPEVIRLVERGTLPVSEVSGAFEFFVWNSLSQSLVEQHAELRDFDPAEYEALHRSWAQCDRDLQQVEREQLRYQALRPAPPGNGEGAVRSWTDQALITRAIAGEAPQVGIRQFMARAGDALSALKPCSIMSPLAAAQYLPPGRPSFDLVIVDGAARLRPVDVISALARGRQAVLFGDSMQLPPPSLASLFLPEEEIDGEPTAPDQSDNALEWAAQRYGPARLLRHHYRSQHDSLIAFSNKTFYEGRLTMAPSPAPDDPLQGLALRLLDHGLYRDGSNLPEAEAVTEAVVRHAMQQPDLSLGIVAVTRRQQELIESLLDRRLEQDRALRTFCATHERTSSSLLIRTLETAQDDVRDVILVSMTYGRDDDGRFFHRFGPLEGRYGGGGVNVLATRSVCRTEVFCSFDPAWLDERTLETRGGAWLKDFLRYAATRTMRHAEPAPLPEESSMEQAVTLALNARGFLVERRVGLAGVTVDLAVRHPEAPGRYLLGILGDAPSLVGDRSSGARPDAREHRLHRLGWQTHRIWSAAWYRNPFRELDRLLDRLQDLVEEQNESGPESPDLVSPGLSNQESETSPL